MAVITMKQLLEAGVHFGHHTRRWNPKMKEYIFNERNGVYIIDLQKTADKIEEAYAAMVDIVRNNNKVLFVGTRKQIQDIIKEEATRAGLIFRSAAALGIDAVLVTPTCCDPFYRRAVRVSMGTVFQVPWARIGEDAADWPQKGVERLRALGFRTAAMALTDNSVSIDDAQLAAEPRLAIVLGTEGDGLSPRTIAACDYTVKIPMAHGVDSLNVAAASAVAFWQLRTK